ncbi:hypothetical protein QR680_015522 [Steinernema hermaphroditum]|uniref:Uncharacterized protein n=1 Tax=Steinernema hermaphroditum TaxID=289476 RepID=A0AA39LKE0_9BILA|nr:hypothetical protein QR680_015522 [Steinernema hermaphroditum]
MTNRPEKCMCGLMHVITGTTIIGSLATVGGALLLLAVLVNYAVNGFLTIPEHLYTGSFKLFIGITTIYGAQGRRPNFLFPMMVILVLSVCVLCMAVFSGLLVGIAPNLFFGYTSDRDVATMRLSVFFVEVMLTIGLVLNVWFVRTIYSCYEYLVMDKEKKNIGVEDQNAAIKSSIVNIGKF